MRLTRRFLVKSLDNISLSNPMRYERYYINDKLRIPHHESCIKNHALSIMNYELCIVHCAS